MTQVNVAGTPISVSLGGGGSTTVPTGEVWKVTVTLASGDQPNVNDERLFVNNEPVAVGHSYNDGHATGFPLETVFVGGDTLEVEQNNDDNGGHIGGFEVSSVVDNTPVSETLSAGGSVTVPTGEAWRVTITAGAGQDPANNNNVILINGNSVAAGHFIGIEAENGFPVTTVVTDGDTITIEDRSDDQAAHIGGFKL
jgi:hypothetical protein